MGQVIQFPTPASRDWKDMVAPITIQLVNAGLSEQAQKHVLERMEIYHGKVFKQEFDFVFPAGTPIEIQTQMDTFVEKLHQFIIEMFIDRLVVEAELVQALKL